MKVSSMRLRNSGPLVVFTAAIAEDTPRASNHGVESVLRRLLPRCESVNREFV